MPDDQWFRAKQILSDFLDAAPDDRDAWLAERCDDAALRAEVESLLAAYEQGPLSVDDEADNWMGSKEEESGRGEIDVPETGTHLGGYRLLEEIGVGGMGVVYRAERADADVEQTVAVKLLQRRFHADDVERRVRAERQVLASLDHPTIAQFLDGGVTEDGRPYLVLEHVDGTTITEYAETHDLDLDARLDLLDQVLEAVQVAHRRLVVHRDLKPSNVLVTETEEGAPRVKLLDFGIAKLLDDSLPVTRPMTRTRRPLLTPAYAAPEQVSGDDVTTATDVYQLGVLAYELLAGARPFDLEGKRLTEIERLVSETEPPLVSERATGDAVAPSRLQGDLDIILATALRTEPDRRYASVEALHTDLRRYRDGEPVEAHPATLGYRAKKFLRRNASGVAVGAAFLIVIAVAGTMLVRQRDRARQEARKAERVSSFLTTLFGAARPAEAQGDTVTARDLMREGRKRLNTLEDQPAVQAQMMYVLGRTHRKLALYDEAERLLRQSLERRRAVYGDTHPEVVKSLNELALFLRDRGEYGAADSLLQQVVETRQRLHGPRHPEVAAALMDRTYILRQLERYEEAEDVIRRAVTIQRARLGAPSAELSEGLYNLAAVLRDEGQYAQAESTQRRSLAMIRRLTDGPHPGVAVNLNNLALVLEAQGKLAATDTTLQRAHAMMKTLYQPTHPELLAALRNLADTKLERGRLGEADSLARKVLALRRARGGTDHPAYGAVLETLGDIRRARGRYAEADSLYQTALGIFRSAHEGTHENIANTIWDRGHLKLEQDSLAAAQRLLQRALAVQRTVSDGPTESLGDVLSDLATVARKQGREERAETLSQKAQAAYRAVGKNDP
jgi:serine/threonine-protein kinase